MKIIKKIIVKLNLVRSLSLFFYIFRIFPIKKNKIVFVNFSGKGYGDSPKYILEELKKQNKKLDMVWLSKKKYSESIPHDVRTVRIFSIKSFYELATAKVWINNSRFDQFIVKRKGQYYIQTWHACIGMKKIEFDAEEKLSEYYQKVMETDNPLIDLMISNSNFFTQLCRRGFRYNGEILEYGTPRNDILLANNSEFRMKVIHRYAIDPNNKILLYAPTFRNSYLKNPYDIDFESVKEALLKSTGYNWTIVIRLHPRISDAHKYIKNIEKYVDATSYDDIQELIMASDLLITDYSSTMFEMMISGKPAIIYANDIESYSDERGMYFKFDELPFPLCQNNDELNKCLTSNSLLDIVSRYSSFSEKINLNETGKSSTKVAERVLSIIFNG